MVQCSQPSLIISVRLDELNRWKNDRRPPGWITKLMNWRVYSGRWTFTMSGAEALVLRLCGLRVWTQYLRRLTCPNR